MKLVIYQLSHLESEKTRNIKIQTSFILF